MSLKIKLFSSTHNNLSSLENEVNNWISLNPEFNFKDIKVTYSDHNVLITLLYEPLGKGIPKGEIIQAPSQSFKDTLTTVSQEEPVKPIIPMPKQQKTESTPENLAAALDDLGSTFVKPGRLIQNNYSKYSKGSQKISEDQAFNWD
ncbi:MAG: hypothetical protein U0354_10650 [Candidatus Sericytochromatia bacterium]